MTTRSHTATRQSWIERIERYAVSGLNVAEFCASEGCSPASFYQWRRKLQANELANAPRAAFVPVKLARTVPGQQTRSAQPQPATVLSLDLPRGIHLRLEVSADEQVFS